MAEDGARQSAHADVIDAELFCAPQRGFFQVTDGDRDFGGAGALRAMCPGRLKRKLF